MCWKYSIEMSCMYVELVYFGIGEGDCARGISSSGEVPPDSGSAEDIQSGRGGDSTLSKYCLMAALCDCVCVNVLTVWSIL